MKKKVVVLCLCPQQNVKLGHLASCCRVVTAKKCTKKYVLVAVASSLIKFPNNWHFGVVVSWSTPEKDNTCAFHRGLWNGSVDVHIVWKIVGRYMWQWNSLLAFAVDFLLSMFLFLQLSCSCFAIDNTSTRDRSYATFWTLSIGSISSVPLGLSTVPDPELEIS